MVEYKKKPRPVKVKAQHEIEDLRNWLLTLDPAIKPNLHVNGKDYPFCILTVDFGEPLVPFEPDADQSTDLVKKMKVAAKELIMKNADDNPVVRVFNDQLTGIYWVAKD